MCSQWILKSVLNCHMNQKHEIDIVFFKVFKRSFLPDASENPAKKEKVPISSFAKVMVPASMWDQDYYENNIKLEQSDDLEASEDLNIKQE